MIYYKNLLNVYCFDRLFYKMKPVHLVLWFIIISIGQNRNIMKVYFIHQLVLL